MKALSIALLAMSLLSAPALAFNGAVDLPNLTFPDADPVTQGCVDPTRTGPTPCPTGA